MFRFPHLFPRGLALALCLLLILFGIGAAGSAAFADAGSAARGDPAKCLHAAYDDGLDNGDCFESYISGLFGLKPSGPARRSVRNAGQNLTGDLRYFYDCLKAHICSVADGTETSTEFVVDLEFTMGQNEFDALLYALIADCPYELYWFDKSGDPDNEIWPFLLYIGEGESTFCFLVAREYAAGEYEVDPTAVNTAKAAVAHAEEILSQYASAPDYDKLLGYKEAICGLVSYDHDAAANPGSANLNAWQLVWVFDGDAATNVVCEGYSKAFQYLCDRTDFDKDVCGYCVTGFMGDESHMWNLVRMQNGNVYLADITNCDSGSIGADDLLFLAGRHSGSVSEGYVFLCGSSEVRYDYDSMSLSLYSTAELSVSDVRYLDDWDAPFYEWSEDDRFVTATRGHVSGGQTETETAETTAEVTLDATCEAMGETTYTAEFENEAFAPQAKTVANLPALGHEWGEASYVWADDNTSVTAARVCAHDAGHVDSETVQASFALAKAPTDDQMGETAFAAEFESTAFEAQAKRVADIPALRDMDVLALPDGLDAIGEEAFANLSCEAVIVPDGCTAIGARAFAGCSCLIYIRIPASVTDLAEDALEGCPAVRTDAAE